MMCAKMILSLTFSMLVAVVHGEREDYGLSLVQLKVNAVGAAKQFKIVELPDMTDDLSIINKTVDVVTALITTLNATTFDLCGQYGDGTKLYAEALAVLEPAVAAAAVVPDSTDYSDTAGVIVDAINASILKASADMVAGCEDVSATLAALMQKCFDLGNETYSAYAEAVVDVDVIAVSAGDEVPALHSDKSSAKKLDKAKKRSSKSSKSDKVSNVDMHSDKSSAKKLDKTKKRSSKSSKSDKVKQIDGGKKDETNRENITSAARHHTGKKADKANKSQVEAKSGKDKHHQTKENTTKAASKKHPTTFALLALRAVLGRSGSVRSVDRTVSTKGGGSKEGTKEGNCSRATKAVLAANDTVAALIDQLVAMNSTSFEELDKVITLINSSLLLINATTVQALADNELPELLGGLITTGMDVLLGLVPAVAAAASTALAGVTAALSEQEVGLGALYTVTDTLIEEVTSKCEAVEDTAEVDESADYDDAAEDAADVDESVEDDAAEDTAEVAESAEDDAAEDTAEVAESAEDDAAEDTAELHKKAKTA